MATTVRKFKETVDLQSLGLKRLKSHKYFPAVTLIVAFLAVSGFHIWQRVHVLSLVRDVAELREENRHLIDLTRKTHNEIASLSMNSRIERYAQDTLGLSLISASRLLTLERPEETMKKPDRLEMVLTSLENVGKYLPTLSNNPVNAAELTPSKLDSLKNGGGQ